MHLSPGAPIMKSYDLVNWEIVNYVFDRADISDAFSLRNGQTSYGQGQWASSHPLPRRQVLRRVQHQQPRRRVPLRTDDIENGAWERTALGRASTTLALLRLSTATPYIFYGSVDERRAAQQPTSTVDRARTPQHPADLATTRAASFIGGLFEGAQVHYIDG